MARRKLQPMLPSGVGYQPERLLDCGGRLLFSGLRPKRPIGSGLRRDRARSFGFQTEQLNTYRRTLRRGWGRRWT